MDKGPKGVGLRVGGGDVLGEVGGGVGKREMTVLEKQ